MRVSFYFNGERWEVCEECGFVFCTLEPCTTCATEHEIMHEDITGQSVKNKPQDSDSKDSKFCQICENQTKHQDCKAVTKAVDVTELIARIRTKDIN